MEGTQTVTEPGMCLPGMGSLWFWFPEADPVMSRSSATDLEVVAREKLSLQDVLFSRDLHANVTWVSDNEILYRDVDGTIFLKNIETDWKTVLASNFSLVSSEHLANRR